MESRESYPLHVFAQHPRDWEDNLYVYPVISRRSGGLSIGINLNPDAACNFDCVYCQVDRSVPRQVRKVDLDILRGELDRMLGWAMDGTLFAHPQFRDVPAELRRLNDIAFSGDGEPTICPVFAEAVEAAATCKRAHGPHPVKIVLITDACYLTRPKVVAGLKVLDANQGEIWAKLDAGTEAYYRTVNRPNYPLAHVITNITRAARERPLCIQSLWMRLHGLPPPETEIQAYIDRLQVVTRAGGRLSKVQIYTLARPPAEPFVAPLSRRELDWIAAAVTAATALPVAVYYGVTGPYGLSR